MTTHDFVEWVAKFLFCFAPAASVSGLFYWLLFKSKNWLHQLAKALSLLCIGFLLFNVIRAWSYGFNLRLAVAMLGVALLLSIVQTSFECDLSQAPLAWWHIWSRSFRTVLCCYVAWATFMRFLLIIPSMPSSSPLALFGERAGHWGSLLGALLTPLSISCFRRVLATIHLRPGLDSSLQEGEQTS